jgi:hypothetical protein
MKGQLIFRILVDVSSYPYEFFVFRDFIIRSISVMIFCWHSEVCQLIHWLLLLLLLIIKPIRCTDFSILFLDSNSFADSLKAVCKTIWHIPLMCVQWKTPDDGQRNCLKHVEFQSRNKFEKSVHLVRFIIRIYHDVWSHGHQLKQWLILHINLTILLQLLLNTCQYFQHFLKYIWCWSVHKQ